jgi:hypothetical protein
MKFNTNSVIMVLMTLTFGAILAVSWITFDSSQSKNQETVSAFKHQMVQLTSSTTGLWKYVNASGEVQQTKDCGFDFSKGRFCDETVDGSVTFRHGADKAGNVLDPVLIIDGQELKMNCVKLGTFLNQRNYCGV